MRVFLLAAIAFAAATAARADEKPVPIREAPGHETVENNCSICHSLDYITMQPTFTRAQWTAEVNKMIKVMGAPIPEESAKIIESYLTVSYGTGG